MSDEKKFSEETAKVFSVQTGRLHRKLKARHLEMIAIGGTIGTGLLLKSGSAIKGAGPLGALICFAIVGVQVYGVITSIGEMATYIPVEGAFSAFPTRFVSPAFGFMSGWNYWLNWALTFPAEMSGIASLMSYWVPTDKVASWIFSLIFMLPLIVLNLFNVSGFAEVEFVLCIIKVVTVILFLIIAFLVWFGVGTGRGALWFSNWNPAIVGSDTISRFLNVGNAFTTAFFSYGGTELVGLTAGEAANPRLSVPRAITGTFWRIIIFYIGAIFFVGVILNPLATWSSSPFVYALNAAGITFAADFINFVVIVAATSAANSSIYACARTLIKLAEDGQAPKVFARIDKRGVPVNSVIGVGIIGLIAVAGSYASGPDGSKNIFNFLSGVISYSIMQAWMIMSITHLRFRAGYAAQGRDIKDLPYAAPFFPYFNYLSLFIGVVVTVFLLISALYPDGTPNNQFFNLDWFMNNSWTYIGIPVTFFLYIGYGLFVPGSFSLVKYEDMDFESNKLIESAKEKVAIEAIHAKPKNAREWIDRLRYKLF